MTYTPPEQYATEKQLSFINALCEQRELTPEVKAHVEGQVVSGTMTKAEGQQAHRMALGATQAPQARHRLRRSAGGDAQDRQDLEGLPTRNGHQVAAELRGLMTDEGEGGALSTRASPV